MIKTKGRKGEFLTVSILYNHVSDYDLWCYYVGFKIQIGKSYLSPLEKEDNPSTNFFSTSSGRLLLYDHSKGKSYTIFSFLNEKYSWDVPEALCHINSDFSLGYCQKKRKNIVSTAPIITNYIPEGISVNIKVKRGRWSKEEIDFWGAYYIQRQTLEELHVQPLECYWVIKGEEIYYFEKKSKELLFVFSFGNAKYKIYRPFGSKKKDKWFNNTSKDILMNEDNLPWVGKNLYITKGMKEVGILKQFGYNVIGLQSEGSYPSTQKMSTLLKKFENIYTIFDADKAGLNGSGYMQKEFGTNPIYLPEYLVNKEVKDLAEIVKINSPKILTEIIHE